MTSGELAAAIVNTLRSLEYHCAERIMTVGAQQYTIDPQTQAFETMSTERLCDELLDEHHDALIYNVMAAIKAERAKVYAKEIDRRLGILDQPEERHAPVPIERRSC